jgi:hypothetical protein
VELLEVERAGALRTLPEVSRDVLLEPRPDLAAGGQPDLPGRAGVAADAIGDRSHGGESSSARQRAESGVGWAGSEVGSSAHSPDRDLRHHLRRKESP